MNSMTSYQTFCENFEKFRFIVDKPRVVKLNEQIDARIKFKGEPPFIQILAFATENMKFQTYREVIRSTLFTWVKMLISEVYAGTYNDADVRMRYLNFLTNSGEDRRNSADHLLSYLRLEDMDEFALAFTPNEAGRHNNEIMEFVGDSIVGTAIVRYLTNKVVLNESRFSDLKYHYIDKKTFSEIARLIGIDRFLAWNMNDVTQSASENAFEAFICALDKVSSKIRARMYVENIMIAADYNLVDMFITFIFERIKIADIVKPDITFISEMLKSCSPDKNGEKSRKGDTFRLKDRKSYYRLNLTPTHIDNLCRKYDLHAYKDQVHELFNTTYRMGYLEEKIAKAIVYKHLVKELRKMGLTVFKYITYKSIISIKRHIHFTSVQADKAGANEACDRLFRTIDLKKYYVDAVASMDIETKVLRIKILPVVFDDISNQCDKTVRLPPNERNNLLHNTIVELHTDYDALVNH